MSKVKSYEQLNELFMRLKNGDSSARNEIIESQMPLVYHIASKYYKIMDRDTAIQQGCLGLIYAVDHFDIDRGLKFSTYAVPTIHGYIKRFHRDRKETFQVKCSRGEYEKLIESIKAEDQLSLELGRTPSDKEVAEKVGIDESELGRLRNILAVSSIDMEVPGKDKKTTVSEMIKDDSSVNEDMIIDKLILEDAISVLDEREQLIIRRRYFEGKTQTEIGEEIGVSQVQVHRLEAKILKKLKKAINKGTVKSTNKKKSKEDEEPMSKNNLADLNNLLFDQLNKLSNPNLKGQELKDEIARAQAVSKVASQIISNGALVLKVKAMTKDTEDIPMLESKSKKRGRPSKDTTPSSSE